MSNLISPTCFFQNDGEIVFGHLNYDSKLKHFYPDLTRYLEKIDDRIHLLLKNPNLNQLVQTHHPQIIKYLCDHIKELFQIAIDSDNKTLSNFVYDYILLSDNAIIRNSLMKSDYLKRRLFQAIDNNNEYALKRIIQLIEYSIQLGLEAPPSSLSFILMLLPYCYETSVYYFFQALCSNDGCFQDIQRWMIDFDFPEILIEELSNVQASDDMDEKVILLRKNLLNLVSFCLKSQILRSYFLNYRLIEILNSRWDDNVNNELWNTISNSYSPETAQYMRGLYQNALDILTDPYTIIKPYIISGIDLLTSMLLTDDVLRSYIAGNQLEKTVLRLIVQFPGHSFLQNALLRFCTAAFQVSSMKFNFAECLIAPLYHESLKSEGWQIRAFVAQLTQKAIEAAQKDKQFFKYLKNLDCFNNIKGEFLKKRDNMLKKSYGGKPPRYFFSRVTYES